MYWSVIPARTSCEVSYRRNTNLVSHKAFSNFLDNQWKQASMFASNSSIVIFTRNISWLDWGSFCSGLHSFLSCHPVFNDYMPSRRQLQKNQSVKIFLAETKQKMSAHANWRIYYDWVVLLLCLQSFLVFSSFICNKLDFQYRNSC